MLVSLVSLVQFDVRCTARVRSYFDLVCLWQSAHFIVLYAYMWQHLGLLFIDLFSCEVPPPLHHFNGSVLLAQVDGGHKRISNV